MKKIDQLAYNLLSNKKFEILILSTQKTNYYLGWMLKSNCHGRNTLHLKTTYNLCVYSPNKYLVCMIFYKKISLFSQNRVILVTHLIVMIDTMNVISKFYIKYDERVPHYHTIRIFNNY